MYWLLRTLFSTVSRLPFAFFYGLSDLAFVILYRVIRYRRELVDQNLALAFPEKSVAERAVIAKQFYRNFTDTFVESVKLFSLSPAKAAKRCEVDVRELAVLAAKGRSIQVMLAHQFNWEYLHLVIPSMGPQYSLYFLYRPIENRAVDKVYYEFRSKNGAIPISADEFASKRDEICSKTFITALGADQNPGRVDKALWLEFFGKPAPFFIGPAKGAIKYGAVMAMLQLKKVKRGHYKMIGKIIAEDPTQFTPEQLTLLYKNEVERVIKEDPSNYLWSHRRWRHTWKPEYGPVYKG